MIVRAEAVPGSRKIDAWLALIFPEGNLVTVLCRGEWPQPADGVRAGRLELNADPALEAWTIACSDTALVFPTAGAAGMPGKGERRGAATQVVVDARLDAVMAPQGRVERETDVNAEGFVRVVSAGRFEQVMKLSGRIKAGVREMDLDGSGIRERAWGPSSVDPGLSVSVVFPDGLAISGRASMRDEKLLRGGWIKDAGGTRSLTGLRLETDHDSRSITAVRGKIQDGDTSYELDGEVLGFMPGREGGLKSRRCVVRYRCGEREAIGFAELIEA